VKCLHCGAAIDLSAATCAACGTLLDADGDGVPDVLAKMIDDKARQLVAEARETQAIEAAAAARAIATRQIETARRDALVESREKLEAARVAPRPRWMLGQLGLFAIAMGTLLGTTVVFLGESLVGRSPIAGSLLCPAACEGCRGPSVIHTWKVNDSDAMIQICQNPVVDLGTVTRSEAIDADGNRLRPYRLSLFANTLLYLLSATGLLFLAVPLLAARSNRRLLDSEMSRLRAEIERLEAEAALATRG
jgi:hypothetical protein